MSKYSSQITMAMDAMCYSTKEILSRVFDGVQVTARRDDYGWDVVLTVRALHRGREIARNEVFRNDVVTDPQIYCEYLRERMPAKVAHAITDYILRGNLNAPRQEDRRSYRPCEDLLGERCPGCGRAHWVCRCT